MLIPMSTGVMQGGGASPMEYIGAIEIGGLIADYDSSSTRLDVLSVAEPGDLIVFILSLQTGDSNWTFRGMPGLRTDPIYDESTSSSGADYLVGFHTVLAEDTNPYFYSFSTAGSPYFAFCAGVFRNISEEDYLNASRDGDTDAFARPDPPFLSGGGKLWLAGGHQKGQDQNMYSSVFPSGFTEIGEARGNPGASFNSLAASLSYKFEDTGSQSPSAIGPGMNQVEHEGFTISFDGVLQ